jgi:single-stranded DNA-binding protein
MKNLDLVLLVSRLGPDLELKYLAGGQAVIMCSPATDAPAKADSQPWQTTEIVASDVRFLDHRRANSLDDATDRASSPDAYWRAAADTLAAMDAPWLPLLPALLAVVRTHRWRQFRLRTRGQPDGAVPAALDSSTAGT